MILASFTDIKESHLQALVDSRAEDRTIDFKRDWSKPDGLAADVCAFANTDGGDIVIGMAERDLVASKLLGVECDDKDQKIRNMESGIASLIEPEAAFRIRHIQLENGKLAFVIRVPASATAPHRVRYNGTWGVFYSRGSAGNQEMDIFRVREAFMRGTLAEERIRQFRARRVSALPNTTNSFPSPQWAWALFQVVSIPAMMRSRLIPGEVLKESAFDTVIFGSEQSTGAPIRFNLDGVVRGRDQNTVQLFRDGKIESQRLLAKLDNRMVIPAQMPESIELGIIRDGVRKSLPNYIGTLQKWNCPPPYSASLTLSNMRGMPVASSESGGTFDADRPVIEIPEVTTDAVSASIKAAAGEITDMLYQAFGIDKTIR